MYEYLIGQLCMITPYYLVIENQGIGYRLFVGNPYRFTENLQKELKMYVHQIIREDAHALYGFHEEREKQLFLKLISVSGIGPKSAMAIMALEDHHGLVQAIDQANVTYLTKFPGVGKKTAQQMILDLKGKLDAWELPANATSDNLAAVPSSARNEALEEALEALRALGYSEKEVKRVSAGLKDLDAKTTDQYLRQALKLLMKR